MIYNQTDHPSQALRDPPMHTNDPIQPWTTRARWVPCDRSCYQTLRWPAMEAGQNRRSLGMPPACPPAIEPPPHRLLAICDESGLRQLVMHHLQRLKSTPLFANAGKCFDCVAMRFADFVVESCGGPLYYSQRHARLEAGAGLPLLLDEESRELWLVQLWHAFDDVGFPQHLRADFWGWAEPLSVHLLAPHSRHDRLTRYPYDTVRGWFRHRCAGVGNQE